MHARRRSIALAALALLAGCSSSSTSGPTVSAAETQAFSYLTNLIPVEITVGGAEGMAIVDTGNPFVLLDPTTFTSAAGLPTNGADVPSIEVGSLSIPNVYAIPTADGLTSPDPAFPLAANLGCTGICSFVATFNYRDVAFGLGTAAPTPPVNLQPETVFDFAFKGGSQVDGVTVPRSRIVVTVSIEGTDYTMIVDTGASYVAVDQATYTAITADGRAQISGGTEETTSGESSSSLTRVASIVVGGVEVDAPVITHDTSFDTNLGSVSTDVGETINGSLGGSYLHDFYVTVDYPATKLHLARYSDLTFAIDPGERLGFQLAQSTTGGYVVGSSSGVAASMGVTTGDELVSINGVDLDGLTAAEAVVLLYGKVGTTKSVAFGTAATLSGRTLSLPVEELLPLPPEGDP